MSSKIEAAGMAIEVRKSENGVVVQADNCTLHVWVYDHNIVRFCYQKGHEPFHDFSYSVCSKPKDIDFEVTDFRTHIKLQTSSLVVNIDKLPLRVRIYTLDGQLINADDRELGVAWIGTEVTAYKQLNVGERFVGMGEKTGGLDRRGKAYTHWNTDSFAYGPHSDPLYCSTPFYIGIHDAACYGIFLDNTHRTNFNFGASNKRFASFSAEDGHMNYYFVYSPQYQIAELLKAYSDLTGYMTMPPKWSLGFQQCRYSYYPESKVRAIAQQFRDNDIPCDVLYLDIHYMDKYKVFTWDNKRFPNPKALINDLEKKDFKLALIFDPGIRVEPGYAPYDKGQREKVFVQYIDKQNYEADVWPGTCCFPDFTNPTTRQWWSRHMRQAMEEGVAGFWADMNEPATWGQATPNNLVFEFEGHKATHREARNVYGMQMARTIYEGHRQYGGGKRPFILTRAGFAGIQRYAAVWTGDNVANDEHMLLGVRLVNSLGLAGVPFAGYDVGGFVGEASPELFARWISIAAFAPFFRCHSMINTKDAEPWSFGEEVCEIARNYIKLRYRLMPYIYSLFYEATQNGMPIARSLTLSEPQNPMIYKENYENEYLLGPSLLIVPVSSAVQITKAYLPAGEWYDFYSDQLYQGNTEIYADAPKERLPVFVKAGAIIPMQADTHALTVVTDFKLYLHLYNGSQDHSFDLYEDDGETHRNEQKDQKLLRTIFFDAQNKRLVFEEQTGSIKSQYIYVKVFLHGFENISSARLHNERPMKIGRKDFRHLPPISNFDPFDSRPHNKDIIADLPFLELKYETAKMVVELTVGS